MKPLADAVLKNQENEDTKIHFTPDVLKNLPAVAGEY